MKAKVLDQILINENKGCYLCSISLLDYLNSLNEDFDKYDVQRKIVNNKYLDMLAQTIFSGGHIPIITLVLLDEPVVNDNTFDIYDAEFRILDGLQRTWRLNTIFKLSRWLEDNYKSDNKIKELFVEGNLRFLEKEKRKQILECGVNDYTQAKSIAKQIIETVGIENVNISLNDTKQWFEVWYGLEKDEIIDKMLLLNAGHKSVSMRHQIELLYYDWFDLFSDLDDITVIRDRDADSPVKFVAERPIKTYRFSDLVMATIAFLDGKYKKIQSAVVQDVYLSSEDSDRFNKPSSFYREVVRFIGKLDVLFYKKYNDVGRKWFGKENNLEALMGAVGKKYWIDFPDSDIEMALNNYFNKFESTIDLLNLLSFDIGKNAINSSKINIGQTNKEVVFGAVFRLLNDEICSGIDWNYEFKRIGGE